MKKNLFFISALCVMAFSLVSCNKDEDESYSIYGDWEVVSGEYWEYINDELVDKEEWYSEGYVIRFKEDGTYWMYEDGELDDAGYFNYDGGKLILEEDGEEFLYEVLSLTPSKMVWEETYSEIDEGDEYKYREVTTLKKVK